MNGAGVGGAGGRAGFEQYMWNEVDRDRSGYLEEKEVAHNHTPNGRLRHYVNARTRTRSRTRSPSLLIMRVDCRAPPDSII